MRTVATLYLLALAPVFAGDTDKKVVIQAAPDETVSLAKQDLDSFKKQGAIPDSGRLSLVQAPEMTALPLVAPTPTPEQQLKNQAQKSGNWLVDGVMGPRGAKPDPKALLNPLDPRTQAGDRADILRQAMAEPGSGARTGDPDGKLTPDDPKDEKLEEQAVESRLGEAKAANPLDSYMAAWMSPKDLEILKPALDSKPAGQGGAPEGGPDLQALVTAKVDRPAPDPGLGKPIENPFIDLLNTPGPPPAQEALFKAAPAPVPELTSPPPLVPDGKAVTPDFAKPLIEDPALKGMKRF